MERRKTLKVSITPDTSIIQPTEDTLIFQTPRPKLFLKKNIQTEPPTSVIHPNYRSLNISKSFLLQLLLILSVALSVYFYSYLKIETLSKTISNLNKQNELFYEKLKILEYEIQKSECLTENYATIEKGAYINYSNTSPCHRYGLFGHKKSKDPIQVLLNTNSISDCYSFSGNRGTIGIVLSDYVFIRGIMIIHPITSNRKSAMREFEVYGVDNGLVLIGKFCFDITEKISCRFDIEGEHKYREVVVKVINNHGKEEYTCLYNVRIFGNK